MYAYVKILRGITDPLIYRIPSEWATQNLPGSIVRVPLRNKEEVGMICRTTPTVPSSNFTIKECIAIEPFPKDPLYQQFTMNLSSIYGLDEVHCLYRFRKFIAQPTYVVGETNTQNAEEEPSITLTQEQCAIVSYLIKTIDAHRYAPVLLHGVTGSGKTEVYKKALEHAIMQNKSVLFLVPEVTLALQFENILRTQCPHLPIYGFHSGNTAKQKRIVWDRLLKTKPVVLVGVHMPIMLPISHLGIIIVDEEHEAGYQEKKHPKLNTKEVALIRAQLYNIPVLLGSATPSICSLYNIKARGWKFFQLTKRFKGSFPTIKTVYLTENKKRNYFWITRELKAALADRLRKGEQSIIFLNRRGYSFFVQCKACSFIFECSSCSVSLTVHTDNQLRCHYCDFLRAFPQSCTACRAPEQALIKKGIGTQQVVMLLHKIFPSARIARADLDSTKKKQIWSKTVEDFNAGHLDIIVGTQTITKGFHFPNVTLVGIIWADLNLSVPFYNATEVALQQLIQVAGRAGRGEKPSEVIVQAMGDHEALSYVDEYRYLALYAQELAIRKRVGYPPFVRFIEIECKYHNEILVEKEAHQMTLLLHQLLPAECTILGPVFPPVNKIQRQHIRKIYIKTLDVYPVTATFVSIRGQFVSDVGLVINPLG
jgi:primosomal protein N' (replication factor Y) (superfamily II helicase)